MRQFHEIQARDLCGSVLQNEIHTKGYALIRNLLSLEDVSHTLNAITEVLSAAGWLLPGHDPLERFANPDAACGDPDPEFKSTYQTVFDLESFHALPHYPALQSAMKMIVGERVLVHPKPIGRLIFPNCERLTVHAHQDYRFMGGDTECFTAWIPLHDCPVHAGPLRVLESSHRAGYVEHADENLHVPEILSDTLQEDDWVSGQINAGDVLLFHSLTVHAASPNLSDRMRISLDCRFQDYRRSLNPANLVFSGESGKSWEKTYAGWRSDKLKYYWKRLPLTLQPSEAEIEQLSQTAEPPEKRARYARMLCQLA
ncbi:phytanoyl-CoA dioxygenase family protein [Acidicapsa dinghuensis]|uniref:Phytanoyl-CoA dioxygenase family protein n=1 Tax=Acidicapsa dinghuensis TaxID=2218256 RepID=A0ABW1EE71_9BACT|nr:phytanoyl-CoA dioxygenase family protein [Acidicapsa dinghuensis]